MRRTVNLTKGLNLALEGGLGDFRPAGECVPASVAVVPSDYPGLTPKCEVAEGDTVAMGQPLLRHKADPDIKLVSPVAGTVEAIVRGARRAIERVVVKPAAGSAPAPVTIEADHGDAASVKKALKLSGLWAMMRQRPYDIIPDPEAEPRDIFVTAMDTAPLALPLEEAVRGREDDLRAGAAALRLLTKGTIYIGAPKGSTMAEIPGTETVWFAPLHPAGNAGIQAANIAPVNKGETVWTLDIVTLARIGALMNTGTVDTRTLVALTGSELKKPRVVSSVIGADIASLLAGDEKEDGRRHRIISGNVLTGIPVGEEGYLRCPYRQVTVIPEGDDADEFMGWASLSPAKMSVSRSFPGRFLGRLFSPDARINGGRRAMIMSGVYDRYMPMDIMPEYLLKAIRGKDIDQMEALGIYEVAPEDFALAEYADPSKLPLQKMVREGLDYLRSEA